MDTVGILFFTLLFVLTSGHSWVERIDGLTLNGLPNTTYNGTVKGPSGYGRGFGVCLPNERLRTLLILLKSTIMKKML